MEIDYSPKCSTKANGKRLPATQPQHRYLKWLRQQWPSHTIRSCCRQHASEAIAHYGKGNHRPKNGRVKKERHIPGCMVFALHKPADERQCDCHGLVIDDGKTKVTKGDIIVSEGFFD